MSQNRLSDLNPYILHCSHLSQSTCPPAGTAFEKRIVKWHELELITWGEGYIFTEGEMLPASQGTLFFRNPGMVVQGIAPYHCYLIVFDACFDPLKLNDYASSNVFTLNSLDTLRSIQERSWDNFFGTDFPYTLDTSMHDKFLELFVKIYNEFILQRPEGQFRTKTYLMQLLLEAYEHVGSLRTGSISRSIRNNYPRILEAKRLIESNIRKPFTLAQLAGSAGLSPNFFCRIFKQITGVTPTDYINLCRINAAKKLLIETNQKITEIAYECGFENDTYFYTVFKNKTGISPGEFRQNQLNFWTKWGYGNDICKHESNN